MLAAGLVAAHAAQHVALLLHLAAEDPGMPRPDQVSRTRLGIAASYSKKTSNLRPATDYRFDLAL